MRRELLWLKGRRLVVGNGRNNDGVKELQIWKVKMGVGLWCVVRYSVDEKEYVNY